MAGEESKNKGGTRIIETPDGRCAMVLSKARLSVEKGPDKGLENTLERLSLTVGTSPEADLRLFDEAVSQRHFSLRVTGVGVLLVDEGSTNGTFVDGRRSERVYLNHNAKIRVGDTALLFRVTRGDVEIPLSRATNFGRLLGHSAAMRAVFAVLEQAAQTDATVLITGESGTGKELAASALHEHSRRKDGPFVVFDCGAASASLVESQLFGHARGAFTGALDARAGVFEAADGGTLMLDEIGELPPDLQPKLLRALETRTIQRLGENKTRSVDVRFVACTNRKLENEVSEGRFRQDLLFRLSVIAVSLPPLRERKEEIPRLVRHFTSSLTRGEPVDIPRDAMQMLLAHDWPGNVRELRNFSERMLTLPRAGTAAWLGVPPEDSNVESLVLPKAISELPYHEAKEQLLDQFERAYLILLLSSHRGNVSAAARAAELSRQSCYRLMSKHGLTDN